MEKELVKNKANTFMWTSVFILFAFLFGTFTGAGLKGMEDEKNVKERIGNYYGQGDKGEVMFGYFWHGDTVDLDKVSVQAHILNESTEIGFIYHKERTLHGYEVIAYPKDSFGIMSRTTWDSLVDMKREYQISFNNKRAIIYDGQKAVDSILLNSITVQSNWIAKAIAKDNQ